MIEDTEYVASLEDEISQLRMENEYLKQVIDGLKRDYAELLQRAQWIVDQSAKVSPE